MRWRNPRVTCDHSSPLNTCAQHVATPGLLTEGAPLVQLECDAEIAHRGFHALVQEPQFAARELVKAFEKWPVGRSRQSILIGHFRPRNRRPAADGVVVGGIRRPLLRFELHWVRSFLSMRWRSRLKDVPEAWNIPSSARSSAKTAFASRHAFRIAAPLPAFGRNDARLFCDRAPWSRFNSERVVRSGRRTVAGLFCTAWRAKTAGPGCRKPAVFRSYPRMTCSSTFPSSTIWYGFAITPLKPCRAYSAMIGSFEYPLETIVFTYGSIVRRRFMVS